MELNEFVGDVRVEAPSGFSEWPIRNRVLGTWSENDILVPVSATRNLIVI